MNYVTDMRHFEGVDDLDGDRYRPAQRFAAYLGDIVGAATANSPGGTIATALPCRRRPGRKPCPGRLLARRTDVPAQIHWACPSCDEQGMIYGWEHTIWDLSPPREPGSDAIEVELSPEDYQVLRRAALLDHEMYRLVISAQSYGREVQLRADEDELDTLLDYLAGESNHEPNARRRRRIDEVMGILEAELG